MLIQLFSHSFISTVLSGNRRRGKRRGVKVNAVTWRRGKRSAEKRMAGRRRTGKMRAGNWRNGKRREENKRRGTRRAGMRGEVAP